MKKVILNEQALTGITVYEQLPIGTPMAWLSDVLPVGFLAFDGAEYNQSDFPELYNVIKNIPAFHSETEGKFKIPNLKGRVLQGADTVIGELIEAGLPNITGNTQGVLLDDGGPRSSSGALKWNGVTRNRSWAGSDGTAIFNLSFNAKDGETKTDGTIKTEEAEKVFGKSDTVQSPAFTVRWIIKATQYASLEQNAIDNTRTTNANVHSALQTQTDISNALEWKLISENESAIIPENIHEVLIEMNYTTDPLHLGGSAIITKHLIDKWIKNNITQNCAVIPCNDTGRMFFNFNPATRTINYDHGDYNKYRIYWR